MVSCEAELINQLYDPLPKGLALVEKNAAGYWLFRLLRCMTNYEVFVSTASPLIPAPWKWRGFRALEMRQLCPLWLKTNAGGPGQCKVSRLSAMRLFFSQHGAYVFPSVSAFFAVALRNERRNSPLPFLCHAILTKWRRPILSSLHVALFQESPFSLYEVLGTVILRHWILRRDEKRRSSLVFY